jgi:hypothetical protein
MRRRAAVGGLSFEPADQVLSTPDAFVTWVGYCIHECR